jgi:Thioredoxin.
MIDCDKNPKLCNKMKIIGYPTLKMKLDNKTIEYKGQRDLNSIKTFIFSYF